MTKERGQTAFQALVSNGLVDDDPWSELWPRERISYAIIETTVRNAALEEAAKVAEAHAIGECVCGGYGCDCGSYDNAGAAGMAARARLLAVVFRAMKEPT
jgi:hypothetical protein